MKFTDIFIERPVLATVLSLLILVLGLRSLGLLPVREYPFTENAVVTVTTSYTGADPALMAGFITAPLENSIAQANGIDYLTSNSTQGISSINAYLRLNYDPNQALTEINTKVNAILNQLPKDAQQPIITLAVGSTIDSMYLGFYSDVLPNNKITDYLIRVVQPKLQAVAGVQQAEILGGQQFALRAWLDPAKLAAYALTAADVAAALANNNFISAAGRTDGNMITVDLIADTNIHSVEEFRNLVIKSQQGAIVRLGDVARVTLGANNYNFAVSFDGKKAVYIGIKTAPAANILTVIQNIREVFPTIQQQLPEGLKAKIVYDATEYVNSAIHEVETSLIEAILIVTFIIFLFLGSLRSVSIPVIAIPLSLIGAFFVMLVLGYTINLLTLLALVLGIGLVVDDAIIVVENFYRHLEEGKQPKEAALQCARELANPIIAITLVLIAVYIPIGFMGGLTGALFTEFAFTLAGAVAISGIVALTLSPIMCSKFFRAIKDDHQPHRLAELTDRLFNRLQLKYKSILSMLLNNLPVILVFALIILASNYFLFALSKNELAPQEDQGIIITALSAAPNASLEQTQLYTNQVYKVISSYPETNHIFQLDGVDGLNSSIAGMVLKPWDQRKRNAEILQPLLQAGFDKISGARIAAFQPAPLPGSSGLPVQLVITTTDSFEQLNTILENIMSKAHASGKFVYLDTDLKYDKAQTNIKFDRDKIAQLGLTMNDVGRALAAALGGGYVNYFDYAGRSYQVIPQVERVARLNYDQLLNYHITTPNGSSIPFSTIASLKTTVVPESLNHFQQLNSITISGVPAPGVTVGEALESLQAIAKLSSPQDYGIDYAGQSRQYIQESSALVVTFFFALIIIYLCLAALFESFLDPLIVLISVPMSICGALIFISLGVGGASLNIYTEVGLVTLIGLISKHGILIVQFANDLRRQGMSKLLAIETAAEIRLRPIIMTTASMVLGVLPLILATGAGAMSRFNIGLVIAMGISIGTVFTLFVVPGMYMLLSKD